jgi:nucleotide-binding universal stress UspA family protein
MPVSTATARTKLGNVLYLTDFSPTSESAIKYVRAIAEQFDSQIFIAHIIETPEYRFVPPEGWAVVDHATDDAARRQLQLVEKRLAGVPHQVLLRHGEVWRAASEMIKIHDIRLIVVGSHGRTGLRRFLMGSVAEEIFRHASCPVLTVGPGVARENFRDSRVSRVVLATDFGPGSLAAIPHALSLIKEFGSRLMLLHVIKPPTSPEESLEYLQLESENKLRELLKEQGAPSTSAEIAVRLGDPREEITRFAREKKADLVILGLKRDLEHVGMATHVSRATAHAVVCSAPCPVLSILQ